LGSNLICKRCNIDGNFSWDRDWHENTGKWRLIDNSMERPHECSHVQEAIPQAVIQESPLVKCPQCDPLKESSWIKAERLQEHIKIEHFGFW